MKICYRRLGLQALSNYARFGVTAMVPLLLTPMMLKAWGGDGFGLWSLVQAGLSLFGLLDLGLSATLVRFLGEFRARSQHQLGNRLVATVLSVYTMLSLLATVVLLTLGWLVEPFRTDGQALALLWILGLRSVTLGLPLGVLRSTLFAEKRFLLLNCWQIAMTLAYGVGAWLLLSQRAGLVELALLSLLVSVGEQVGYLVLLRRSVVGFRLLLGVLDLTLLRRVWGFSLAAGCSTLAGLVLLKTDPILVAACLPLSAVATYALALKLAEGLLLLLKQAVNVLSPHFAECWARGDLKTTRELFVRSSIAAAAVAAVLTVPALLFTEQIFTAWLGQGYSQAIPVARLLLLAAALSVPQMIASSFLTMCGQHRFTASAAILSAVINLSLSLLLVGPLGLRGVALATLLTTIGVDLGLVLGRALKILQIHPYRKANS